MQGEHLFPIAGMDFPALSPGPSPEDEGWEPKDAALRRAQDAAQHSAVQLFLQGARRAQPGFELTTDNLGHVVRICRLVQGMPLAILLAAAWVQMLTPADIAAEIGQGLDFLETDLHDVPERQRSVRAVFDHSWHLLTEREREVFQALSVFRGGFTRQAAGHVIGASLRELRALVDKSLLHRTPVPSATLSSTTLGTGRAGGRYEVHELLQQYAAEKLEGSPTADQATRDRHCAYYATALQQRQADLKGPRPQAALAEIETESENARVAWTWAARKIQVERLEQAMEGLCFFYLCRMRYKEGEAVCRLAAEKLALAVTEDGLRVLAKVLMWQGCFSWRLGRTEFADQLLQKSLVLLERPELANRDTRPEKAAVLLQMGHIDFDYSEALRTASEMRTIFPLVTALPAIALLLVDRGEKERAVELYALALRYPRVANSRWFEDIAGRHLAAVAATLSPGVVAAAQARGRARDLDATVAELLVELGKQ